jgi:hypothetical protein
VGGAGCDIGQVSQLVGVLTSPWDGILIYGFSFLIARPLHGRFGCASPRHAAGTTRVEHAALLMSVVYITYVSLNYTVQLAVVIPRLTTQSSIDVLDQTPHSLFWTVDALGYIFLGAATLLAVPVFTGSKPRRWVRRFFLANMLVTPVVSPVYFYPSFSIPLLFLIPAGLRNDGQSWFHHARMAALGRGSKAPWPTTSTSTLAARARRGLVPSLVGR